MLARKDIKRAADLKGKSIGVTRPGDFPYRLAKEFLKKHNLSEKDVTLASVGGTPTERYAALLQDVFQATLIQPPLDARGKRTASTLSTISTILACRLSTVLYSPTPRLLKNVRR